MNNILNKLIKSTQTIKSLAHHPLKAASLEQKILYLNVLCLLHDEKKLSSSYLAILLNAVDVDSSMKQDFLDFAKDADEEAIVKFIQEFSHSSLALPFLSDCLMLCACEDELDKNNTQVINRLAVELGVHGDDRAELHKNFMRIKDSYFDKVNTLFIAEHVISYFKAKNLNHYRVVLLNLILRTALHRDNLRTK